MEDVKYPYKNTNQDFFKDLVLLFKTNSSLFYTNW